MVNLEGNNLCQRQKDFNLKVKEAVKNKIALNDVECEEGSDIDRVFKIALASEYRNADYIVEQLKSGDSLYISWALKCTWLYSRDYADVINLNYLLENVFPSMSIKMQKKMLTTIAFNVKDEAIIEQYFTYCMDKRFSVLALKFLLFTSQQFKANFLNNEETRKDLYIAPAYYKRLIGDSFELADIYGKNKLPLLHIDHLYSINELKYLDLLETYRYNDIGTDKTLRKKVSRSIMKKHKYRVLRNILIYEQLIKKDILVRYSSTDVVKIYLEALLPDDEDEFWEIDFCAIYDHIIEKLPTENRFQFIKQIFEKKYGPCDFEMHEYFYDFENYKFMTREEREEWAMGQLQMQRQRDVSSVILLMEHDNYKWCEFLPFAECVQLIHKTLGKTQDPNKRSEMLRVLVKTANTASELEYLLNYYYNTHIMTEETIRKGQFLDNVIGYHNVFQFNEACWVAFDMIVQNFLLHPSPCRYFNYFNVSLLCRILRNKTLPQYLRVHILSGYFFVDKHNDRSCKFLLNQLKDHEKQLVYERVSDILLQAILDLEPLEYNSVKLQLRNNICHYINCRDFFEIKDDYPDVIKKYIKLDEIYFAVVLENQIKNKCEVTEAYLIRRLKQNASEIVDLLPNIIAESSKFRFYRINMLLRKIKLYFSKDIAQTCIHFFTRVLNKLLETNRTRNWKAIHGIVYAIFVLGDEKAKTNLMFRFAPKPPITEVTYNVGHIIQAAICRFVGYSRPAVSLCQTAFYLHDEYLYACEGMLYMQLSNLTPKLRADFIKLLLNSSQRVRERGSNLVLQMLVMYNDFLDFVSDLWIRTSNFEIRETIYNCTFDNIRSKKGSVQVNVMTLLLTLTLNLLEDDCNILSRLRDFIIPASYRCTYLKNCWANVVSLPTSNLTKKRKIMIVEAIARERNLLDQTFLYDFIRNYVTELFELKANMFHKIQERQELDTLQYNLMISYICDLPNVEAQENSAKIVNLVMEESFKRWNDKHHPTDLFYSREFFFEFVDDVITRPSYFDSKYIGILYIAANILDKFERQVGITEAYSRYWDWSLSFITRKAISGKRKCDEPAFIDFGLHLGNFIYKLKRDNCYYISFFDKIFGKILSCIQKLNDEKIPSVTAVDASVLLNFGLCHSTVILENLVLAIKLMPVTFNVSRAYHMHYAKVLQIVKVQNNSELKALLKEKYECGGVIKMAVFWDYFDKL